MTESNLKQALNVSPSGCQPLNLLVAFALEEAGVSERERDAVRAHVATCAACSHEVEMAQVLVTLDVRSKEGNLDIEAVAQITARLEEDPRFMADVAGCYVGSQSSRQ